MNRSRFPFSLVLATVCLVATPTFAVTVELVPSEPSEVGQSYVFKAVAAEAIGEVTFEWRFGESDAPVAGGAEMSHTFTAPGHYSIDVSVTDANGDTNSDALQHLVHFPLTAKRPTSSTSIVYDQARNRVYSVNQDNDTVTAIDAEGLTKAGELEVYRRPESLALTPEGKLWVVHQDDYAVAVIDPDSFTIERGFRLPYASQPVGVAMSPTGDAAYVSLLAVGKLLKLDPRTGDTLGEVDVGPRPRGIAVSHDGKDVYVTRFISPDAGGEVVKVDAAAMTVATRILLKLDRETVDSDQRSRGLPNYLFSVGLTPDGRQAWIPGKKDNVVRGKLLDGQDITHDTTVRPMVAVVDTQAAREIFESRIDLDDRSVPVHVDFTPFGDFAILTLAASNRVEIRDVNDPTKVFSAIGDVGAFPRASVLTPSGRLFVQASLSREVTVYDMSLLMSTYDKATPIQLETVPAVGNEKLSPQVLLGKKLFHDAEDRRMAFEGYLSCGTCHFEGIDDGRVYDFTTRGEGLRNTLSLLGRGGAKQGRLNWTGNLDEVQDFEHQIRELFEGNGFIPDEVFHEGTRDQALGDKKAGLSPELDALAAYVSSLEHVNPSPHRNPDGTMTADGVAGKVLFGKLGCDFCHAGPELTDSERGLLHDVGTLTSMSGMRAGGPLVGLDTPTLLGVWETPPYLHDGSAATLRDVLTTRNPTDLHGYVSSLSPTEVDQLVAYLEQIDDELPPRRLPFEPPMTGGTGGPSGTSGGGGSIGGAGGGSGGRPPTEKPAGPLIGGCGCGVGRGFALGGSEAGTAGRAGKWSGLPSLLLVGLAGVAVARRRRRRRSSAGSRLVAETLAADIGAGGGER